MGQVQQSVNPDLKFLGILPTMADNTAMTRDTRQDYDNSFGELIFPMNISKSVTAAYSSREKKALCFKASSKIGMEYKMFAEEVERRIHNG
ncbi:MAG: ParA family protein [Oscillospiraceae bacterium]